MIKGQKYKLKYKQKLWKYLNICQAFDSTSSLESDKMTVLWPNDSITFTFYVKEVFNSMNSLESDKMIAMWRNDSLTFTFH